MSARSRSVLPSLGPFPDLWVLACHFRGRSKGPRTPQTSLPGKSDFSLAQVRACMGGARRLGSEPTGTEGCTVGLPAASQQEGTTRLPYPQWGRAPVAQAGRSLRDGVPLLFPLRTIPYRRPTHELCNSPWVCSTLEPGGGWLHVCSNKQLWRWMDQQVFSQGHCPLRTPQIWV